MSRPARPSRRGRPAFVLVVALVVVLAVASLVITLARAARVDARIAANQAAACEAQAVERGVEQYILALLTERRDTLGQLKEEDWAAIPVGTGYAWVVRPDYGEADLPRFGLVDESAKLNLNTVDHETLMRLPNMTDEAAGALIDWRDADDDVTGMGAESGTYLTRSEAYRAKNALFETVDEMRMVNGVTPELFYGEAATADRDASAMSLIGSDALSRLGWREYFTVWSAQPPPGAPAGAAATVRGRINVNQAPRDVLACLPGLTPFDVDALLAGRPDAAQSDPADTAWVADVLGARAAALADRITGQGLQFSADIVAASGNGRAFRHVRIVVDASVSPAQIVQRRDLSEQGFPLAPEILDSLRSGRGARLGR